jgi:hypothetical protein
MAQLRKSTKWIARIFKRLVGCRHSQMSRPFTVNDEPYRLCWQCGANRRVDKYRSTKRKSLIIDAGNFSVDLTQLTARYADHRTLLSQQPGKRERS